jgi:hypothetical protein
MERAMTKRLMCLALIWSGVALTPAVALARLGETEEELVARFGRSTSQVTDKDKIGIADKELMFEKNGTIIHATIYNGVCVGEGYEFMDRNGNELPLRGDALEKAEAALGANAAGFRWQKHPDPSSINPEMMHAWNRTDGQVSAVVWRNSPNILEITDMGFLREANQAKRAKAAGDAGF